MISVMPALPELVFIAVSLLILSLVLFAYHFLVNKFKNQNYEDLPLQQEYQAHLKQITQISQQAVLKSQAEFDDYLADLRNRAQESLQGDEEAIKKQINALFETFEQNLSNFLTSTQKQSTQAVQLEIAAARNLIESYKKQQFTLIDENIVAMLEKTLTLVLAKKLSLEDQVDLIYESLEKAKADKFIA